MKDLTCTLPFAVYVARLDIMLSSSVAKSLRRICWVTDWSLYTMGITLRKRTTVEKVEELERIVYDEILKPLEGRLQAEYVRINLLYEQCGIKPSRRKSEKITVDLRHPHGNRLFDLLVGLDKMACQLDDLRFDGKITEIEHKETVSICQSSLREAALGIRRLVGRAMKQAERKMQRQGGEEWGEKDKDLSQLEKIFQCSSGSSLHERKKIN